MDFYTYHRKIERLKFLIQHNMIRTSSDVAEKLDISQRTAYRMIAHLKDSGETIRFCRYSRSYKFKNEIAN